MADVTKEIALEVSLKDSTSTGTQSAKQRLRELQKELIAMAEAGQQGTDAFKRLEQQAGSLKDEINDVNQRVKNLASDTKRIDAFVGAVQGIAAGFQIAQGAAALFGDENEDLQKAMLKVQGAMALANGVQQVANLLQKESALMMGLNTLATNAASAAQKAYAIAVGTSTGAMRAFRIALAATGIGAIVVALGFAAEAMGLFSSKTDDAAESQKNLQRAAEDTVGTLEYQERKLKAYGATEADLAKKRKKTREDELANDEAVLKDFETFQGKQLTGAQKTLRDRIELTKIRIREEQNIIDAAAKKEADQAKSDKDKKIQTARNTANELASIQKKYADEVMLQNLQAQEREFAQIDLKYAADLEKLKKHGQDTANLQKVIDAEKAAIKDKYTQEQFDKDFAGLEREAAAEKAFLDANQQEISNYIDNVLLQEYYRLEQEKLIAEERKKIEKSVAEYKQQVVSDSLTSISQILQAFGNESKELAYAALLVEKGAGIANVIINLQKEMAANAATAAANPLNAVTGGAAGIAQAAKLNTLAKIRAALRIAAITATGIQAAKAISSGGGGGGGGGGSTVPAPAGGGSTTAPAQSFANPNTTMLGNQGQPVPQPQATQPMRAYVVERDIQQTTSRVRRLSEFATLG